MLDPSAHQRHAAAPRARAMALLAAAVLFVGGCTSEPIESTPVPSGDFALMAQGYLNQAEELELDERQIAVLERAVTDGMVAFEDYQAAVHTAVDCIAAAGYHTEVTPAEDARGFAVIDYFYEGPEDGNPVADACIRQHSGAVEALYQLQPSSIAAQDRRFLDGLDEVVACLSRAGVEWDTANKTADELKEELLVILQSEPLPTDGTEGPILSCSPKTGF